MSVASALRAVREMKVEYHTMSGVASLVIAADFATGGEAWFARACSAKGDVLEIIRREEDESHVAFVDRAKALQRPSQRLGWWSGAWILLSIRTPLPKVLHPHRAPLRCRKEQGCTRSRRAWRGSSSTPRGWCSALAAGSASRPC